MVAAKTWYDEAVFSVDFTQHLPNLIGMNELEATFLRMLNYNTTVSVSLFVRYAFALQDVSVQTSPNRSPLPRKQRPRSWSPGLGDPDPASPQFLRMSRS